jgi:hypothetical protein
MASIRTANVSAGFECHIDHARKIEELDLHYAPGTSVELLFGLSLRSRERARTGRVESASLKDFVVIDFTPNEASSAVIAAAMNQVEEAAEARLPIVIVQCHGWPLDGTARAQIASSIRDVAAGLEGHAAVAAVLFTASDVDCDTVFRTIDDLHEAVIGGPEGQSSAVWCPPFLVVGVTGLPMWSGGTPALRRLLYRMLEGETIEYADSGITALAPREADYLKVEQDWFGGAGPSRIRLRVSSHDVDNAVGAHLKARLERALASRTGGQIL